MTTRDETTLTANTLTGNIVGIAWYASDGLVEGNTVSEGQAGIVIGTGSPVVRGNVIEDVNGRGLVVTAWTSPTLSQNRACGNGANLVVADGATATIEESNVFCPDAPE